MCPKCVPGTFCRCSALVFCSVSWMCPACVRALFLVELCSTACVPMCPAAFGGRVLDVSLMCPGMRAGA